jgi:hypothetical protein
MVDESANEKSSLRPGEAQQVEALKSETIAISHWDQLLGKLELTEQEALTAIALNNEIGRVIRQFVQDSARARFIPEDVLIAVNQRESRDALARSKRESCDV